MKITQVLRLMVFSFLFFRALDSHAQQLREMQPLDTHDFECLQSLECVQSSQSLKSKGWSFVFDETVDQFARELTARMEGEHISLFATYDKQGYVIRSKYHQQNAALPICLLKYLAEGNYKEWQIASSEMVMKNFDPASVKYKVVLENKTLAKSEVFDFEFVNNLHLKHGGLVKHWLK